MPITNYIWDVVSDNVLMEVDDAGNTIASYEHEPGLYGEIISQRRNGQTSYYKFDGQGSTRELTDQNHVTDTYTYDAFGVEVARTGMTANPFGFKGAFGYYTNPLTNHLYVRERTLETIAGRWLSPDPLGFLDGANRYPYVRNNPLLFADPSGTLCAACCCCAESLTFDAASKTTTHPYIRPDTFGHYFELIAKILLKVSKDGNPGRCDVEWWEFANTVPGRSKCNPNEWCKGDQTDLEEVYGKPIGWCGNIGVPPGSPELSEGTLTRWCRFFHPDHVKDLTCTPPSEHTIRLIDAPRTSRRENVKRNLYFHVVIKSADNCTCGEKNAIWEGCQLLETDANGMVVKQELHETKSKCPNFPTFEPPKKKT